MLATSFRHGQAIGSSSGASAATRKDAHTNAGTRTFKLVVAATLVVTALGYLHALRSFQIIRDAEVIRGVTTSVNVLPRAVTKAIDQRDKVQESERALANRAKDFPASGHVPHGAVEIYSYSIEIKHGRPIKGVLCRVFGAGIVSDRGVMVLPFQTKPLMEKLSRRCGWQQKQPVDTRSLPVVSTVLQPFNRSDVSDSNDVDVLAGLSVRTHIPHFFQDAWTALSFAEVVFGERSVSHNVDYECYLPSGEVCTWQRDSGLVRPAFWLEGRAERYQYLDWVRTMLGFFPPKGVGFSGLYTADKMTTVRARSVFSFAPGADWGNLTVDPQNPFFAMNGINKSPRAACPARVTILNRPATSKNFLHGGREIMEVDELTNIIKSAGRERGRAVEVLESSFDGLSVREQIDLMQSTDLLIISHGAGLTNTIFLPMRTTVIEVFPFLYYPQLFNILVRRTGGVHVPFDAEPDLETYLECLQKYNSGDKAEQALKYMEKVRRWAKAFSVNSMRKNEKEAWNVELNSNRVCLRAQRLYLSKGLKSKLAKLVVSDPNLERCRL
ncbi:hypothetical protein FVE85_1957 [Porphyridium purpureum]|uniref:Glycosyltransferase 61 catalytic domain-containing protein n=1 Tax=Porphyridium purpureum TaxID=35688 RepID=A0A5J4YY44_PORPP|nr:hypothetical protein FVE85_1957 [Porphyridium purpureum]|eukprot:POR0821..scf209_3